jgi:hypothetical protein
MAKCPYCGGDPDASVVGRWEVFLPLQPSSQNEMTVKSMKGAFAARRKYKMLRDGYGWLLKNWKGRDNIPLPSGRRRAMITRYYTSTGRPFDKGNLIGGMKPLLDAMVLVDLLIDDNEDTLEDHYGQQRVDGEPGVHVVLEELLCRSSGKVPKE